MKNRVRVLLFAFFSINALLTGCKTDQLDVPIAATNVPAIPVPALKAYAVTPATGFAKDTPFTFKAESIPDENFELVLMVWSPTLDNVWEWLSIPMEKGEGNTYTVTKGLPEFSSAYKYKYVLLKAGTDYIVSSSEEFSGPLLAVDASDITPPHIIHTYPEDMSVGVEPGQEILFVFDEVIDAKSVNTLSLSVSNNLPLSNISVYQNRVKVKFAVNFQQKYDFSQTSSKYTLTMQGVTDLKGNWMQPYTVNFHIKSPLLQTYSIESRKYANKCITVVDVKKRFAAPQSWNPVVQLTSCVSTNDNFSQRWFFEKEPGVGGSGLVRWSANYDYCLSKKSASDPVIERCDTNKSEQHFTLDARNDYYLLPSDHGGCVAAGVVDVGDINKVESSLCTRTLERNHWYVTAREKQELSKAFMLGKFDVRFANINYENAEKGVNLGTAATRELVQYLYQTRALNQQEIYDQLNLVDGENKGEGYQTANPYYPRYSASYADSSIPLPKPRSTNINGIEVVNPEAYEDIKEGYKFADNNIQYYQQKVVTSWFSDVTNGKAAAAEVCAIQFTDANQVNYNLRTFASKQDALNAGWTITHQYKCGTCSTLQDLAVYMGVKDQTTPVRLCAKRGKANMDNLDTVKQCIQESVGFTPMCAESWAYNSLNTGKECQGTCMKTYGNDALFFPTVRAFFTMVIAEKFNSCPADVETDDPVLRAQMQASGCPLANEKTGKLNDCLWCDERISGPGFKYAAGRTRRASGLKSEIPRPNDKLFYDANHTLYFQ